jgi:hypothetical protein
MGLDVSEVAKATANIERIRSFLAPRVEWAVNPQSRAALVRIVLSLQSIEAAVVHLLGEHEPSDLGPAPPGAVEALEPGSLNEARLAKIAQFADQLAHWFEAHDGQEPGTAATELGRLRQGLTLTVHLMEKMIGIETPSTAEAPAAVPPAADLLPEADPLPGDEERTVGSGPVALGPASASRIGRAATVPGEGREKLGQLSRPAAQRSDALVLDPAGEEELLVMRNDQVELSPSTRRRLDEYLESEQVELTKLDRRTFERKVLRWIEAIPIGQILIIKITDLNDRTEPYARYQPRPTADPE